MEAKLFNPRYDAYQEQEQQIFLLELMQKAHVLCSQKFDEKACLIQIIELQPEIKNYFAFLTLQEIEIYFKRGIAGAYGEWFGLNFKTYIGWINAGRSGAERQAAIEAIEKGKKELEPKPKELTLEEKYKIMRDSLIEKYDQFKAVGVCDILAIDYDFLERQDVIKFTLERKQLIKQMVEKNLHDQAVNDKGKSEKLKDKIARLLEPSHVKAQCKRQAVIEYFKQLIEMQQELNQFI